MADLAGYRRVNYYELCRLCTSSEGTKMHIFREEGRRRSLPSKIQTCLPLTVQEEDSLPKIICSGCVEKLENYYEFRESCINAEAMLESYFTSLRYSDDLSRDSREGKVSVYVKEECGTLKKKDEPSPLKQKTQPILQTMSTSGSSSVPTSTHTSTSSVATAVQHNLQEGSLHNVPSTIQILSEQDVNRLTQFKVHVQGGVPSLVPAYPSMQIPVPVHQIKTINVTHDGTQTSQAEHVQQPMMTSVTVTPQQADLFSRFARPQMQEVKMKNISIIDTSGATIEPGMAQIRLDPEQINQLMNGSGLQLSLAQITKVKDDNKDPLAVEDEKELEELNEPEMEPEIQLQEPTETDQTPAEPLFDCDICDKIFRRKEHLLQHKKSHTGQRPFVCAYCSKAFSRKEHLIRHKVSHTGQKMYTCDVCSKNFSRKDNLHKHKKTHGINGPHVCETCGKSFVVKHYYALHRASHEKEGGTGSAPAQPANRTQAFRCDICPKIYSSQANLDTHRQRHKTKEKERIKTEQRHQSQQQQPQQQQQQQVQQQTSQPQPTILTSFPINAGLATINPHALLTPGGIVHSTANMVQIGNTSYVCTSDLLDTYRRLHS